MTNPKVPARQLLQELSGLVTKHQEALMAAVAADFGKMPFEQDQTEFHAVQQLFKTSLRSMVEPPGPTSPQIVLVPDFFPLYVTFEPVIALLSRNISAFVHLDPRLPNLKKALADLFQALGAPDYLDLLSSDSSRHNLTAIYTGYPQRPSIQAVDWKEQLWSPPVGIVDETANLEYLATRLTWQRFFGKGTTHLEPQILFVQVATQAKLLSLLRKKAAQFQETGLSVQVDEAIYQRWSALSEAAGKQFWLGAKADHLCPFAVTFPEAPDWLFQERIPDFVLPVISFKSIREILRKLEEYPPAVVWHLFSRYKPHVFTIMGQDFPGAFGLNEFEPAFLQPVIPFGKRRAHSLADRKRGLF